MNVDAGDLSVKFNGKGNGYLLARQFAKAGELLAGQLEIHDFNMEQLGEVLPDFSLTIDAAQKNILNSYLKNNGMRFKRVGIELGTDTESLFKMDAGVFGLDIEGFVIDSVFMNAHGQGVALRYGVNVFGAKNQLEALSQLTAEGSVEHDQVNVRLRDRGEYRFSGQCCQREYIPGPVGVGIRVLASEPGKLCSSETRRNSGGKLAVVERG